MRRLSTAPFIVALLSVTVAEGQEAASSQNDGSQTEIRGEMLSEYRFAPPGSNPAAPPTSFQSDSPALPVSLESKGDVVKMEPFVVRESASSIAGNRSIEKESPAKTPTTVAGKLGIGEHDFMVGKTHAFVITIFYVPIAAGFSW